MITLFKKNGQNRKMFDIFWISNQESIFSALLSNFDIIDLCNIRQTCKLFRDYPYSRLLLLNILRYSSKSVEWTNILVLLLSDSTNSLLKNFAKNEKFSVGTIILLFKEVNYIYNLSNNVFGDYSQGLIEYAAISTADIDTHLDIVYKRANIDREKYRLNYLNIYARNNNRHRTTIYIGYIPIDDPDALRVTYIRPDDWFIRKILDISIVYRAAIKIDYKNKPVEYIERK